MDKTLFVLLQQNIQGDISFPGEELYEKASHMFMGTIKPQAVVRPKTAQSVSAVVLFAKKHELNLAIRSGGHSNIAKRIPDGGLLLDMSGIASITIIDEQSHIVRIGAGAIWYDVASELGKYNLSISSGDTRTVGVGGLTIGGGIGWVVRKFGLTIDQLIRAEVVTADGNIFIASATENPDLFWAIRGGGSNFGIVTHFEFVAHELEGIFAGTITYPLKDIAKVIKGWRNAMRKAPLELTTMLLTLPSFGPDSPASITINTCYAGTDEIKAKGALAPLLSLGEVSHQDIKYKPYSDILEDAHPPAGRQVIVHNTFCKEFSDECIETIAKLCEKKPPVLQIRHIAGAMSTVLGGETAFSYRDSEVLIVNPAFIAPDASEAEIATTHAPWHAIEPYGRGPYLNLISEDTGVEVAQAFLPETLARLERIKAVYDPDDFFNSNYNIQPKAANVAV